MNKLLGTILAAGFMSMPLAMVAENCDSVSAIPFGNMDSWITRNIKESKVIGGKYKSVYAIGPTQYIQGSNPYVPQSDNPWASSNVLAKVCGVVKTSNAVFPGQRTDNDNCAVLTTKIEQCKVIGLFNINVLVSGSIFLGEMIEPISSTNNPYSKMEMGVPFSGRPQYLQFDYKLVNPANGVLTYADGGKIKKYAGEDHAEVFVILQHRWEDADGNLYAKRVATGRERYAGSTDGWVNSHRLQINYGDISQEPFYKHYMCLIPEERSYYARNSKGKMVPVKEVGWATDGEESTHILIMASSGCGTAYTGAEGMEFSVDNFSLIFLKNTSAQTFKSQEKCVTLHPVFHSCDGKLMK